MADEHLSLETMAKWLSGRLEHEAVVAQIVPHLVDRCPLCHERYEQIRRLKREVGHEDEEVGVFEWQEAPDLLRRLEELPLRDRHRKIQMDEGFHTWGLCQLLLQRSREVISEDPALALTRAELAVEVTGQLSAAYDPGWVLDMRARAYAHLGNARRVLGELWSAEAAFRDAETCLERSATGNGWVEAEIVDLKSSLCQDQRRFDEALGLLDRALGLYREEDDARGIGKVLVKRGNLFREKGDLEQAIDFLRESLREIDAADAPRLSAAARHNLLYCLTEAGRFEEAWKLVPEVRDLFRTVARPVDLIRLRWSEANIALGLSRLAEAEAAYRDVKRELLDVGMSYDAALVSLDLALLLARQGRTEELKNLATELVASFEARDIHREAMAALILFQRTCEEGKMTADVVARVAALLRGKEESSRN
jgi:tetratricopeptide (TPR) repeat protein